MPLKKRNRYKIIWRKLEFLFVTNNLIKKITKEIKPFLNRRYQTNYEMILLDNMCLPDITHTCMCTYRHIFTQHLQELQTHIQTLLGVKQKNIVIKK